MTWFDPHAPATLHRYLEELSARLGDAERHSLAGAVQRHPEFAAHFYRACAGSLFFREAIQRQPALLTTLLRDDTLYSKATADTFTQAMGWDSDDVADFDRHLRQQRLQAMLRIVWRDFNRLAALEETTRDLSQLAEAAIQSALEFHTRILSARHGAPRDRQGEIQPMLVLGMGKLGAYELNLSSDIDLIFCFPHNGETERGLSNQEFFTQLGKALIQSLDKTTADGFVFRVDMRLRPYGQSGALVYSFGALEEYYQTQGREWERYAMIKARVVASTGTPRHSHTLMQFLHHFTYRKYVDFSVIEALRKLKRSIRQEVARRGLADDVKLGGGGIREVEFTAQVFQLIRGGRDAELRNNRLLEVLPLLVELRCLPAGDVAQLLDAYRYLRNVEHAIQGYRDEQTQTLPRDGEARSALLTVMDAADWDSFRATLDAHRQRVRTIFEDLIAEPESKRNKAGDTPWTGVWQSLGQGETAQRQLSTAGHENVELSAGLLKELGEWSRASAMQASSRERLDEFMPILLRALAEHATPTETLRRIITLVKAVARRSAYLLLLMENHQALNQLLTLTQASPLIADRLADHPALLDELLDPTELYVLPKRAELQAELRRAMLRVPEDDLEAQMESLRYFRSAHALRVAACEISGALPLMKVSDYLTWIAEVILEYSLHYAWRDMVGRHGYPDGEFREQPKMCVIAYGKLGGIELSHGSDLDLVFIHGATLNGETDGERAIDNQTFYTRVGQKIIHFLTTNMSSGPLYEVDMRLRPSGNSGMLVASVDGFAKYQRESAWTWEHQALVRARAIAGDPLLTDQFNQVRLATLCRERPRESLRREVVDMRNKMRSHLGRRPDDHESFDLKHDAGGIVDIEFMVQYTVLAWAHRHPGLATYTDNIRILESVPDSVGLTTHEVAQLTEAYKAFRAAGHRLTLQQLPSTVNAGELVEHRRNVSVIWQRFMEGPM